MLLVFWFALKLQDTFVSCIADLFENQVVLFEGTLKSGRYANEVRWTVFSQRLNNGVQAGRWLKESQSMFVNAVSVSGRLLERRKERKKERKKNTP